MSKFRNQIIFRLIVSHILIVPVLTILSLLLRNSTVLIITISQTVLIITFLSGYWEFQGLRFRWIYCLAMEILILISLTIHLADAPVVKTVMAVELICITVQLILFYYLIRMIIVIFKKDKERTEIQFPFKNGLFLITDGGNARISRLMNYHYHSLVHKKRNTHRSMLYATDVVKLKGKGSNFFPQKNEDYPVFEEDIHSLMGGKVFRVVDDIPDNLPFSGNYPYNTGNTVVIRNGNYYLLLGHIKMRSILVKEGDMVNKDDIIAKAGNSGYSERPHLHFQLIRSETDDFWKGTGICVTFRNKNLYKNKLIKN